MLLLSFWRILNRENWLDKIENMYEKVYFKSGNKEQKNVSRA